jgi:hypothetical protein
MLLAEEVKRAYYYSQIPDHAKIVSQIRAASGRQFAIVTCENRDTTRDWLLFEGFTKVAPRFESDDQLLVCWD